MRTSREKRDTDTDRDRETEYLPVAWLVVRDNVLMQRLITSGQPHRQRRPHPARKHSIARTVSAWVARVARDCVVAAVEVIAQGVRICLRPRKPAPSIRFCFG